MRRRYDPYARKRGASCKMAADRKRERAAIERDAATRERLEAAIEREAATRERLEADPMAARRDNPERRKEDPEHR